MSKRTMTIVVHEEDVRKVATNSVGFCLDRFNKRHNVAINNLNDKLSNGTKIEIAQAMNEIVKNTLLLKDDLQETLGVIDQLDPDGSGAPDT